MTGRFALLPDTKGVSDQLAALERLRAYIRIGQINAAHDIVDPVRTRLGITPSPATVQEHRKIKAQCLSRLSPSRKQ